MLTDLLSSNQTLCHSLYSFYLLSLQTKIGGGKQPTIDGIRMQTKGELSAIT
jgi:hypothetical protein